MSPLRKLKNTYYVKYKDFVGFFTYSQDPGIYYTEPIKQKVLTDNKNLDRMQYTVEDWSGYRNDKSINLTKPDKNSEDELE